MITLWFNWPFKKEMIENFLEKRTVINDTAINDDLRWLTLIRAREKNLIKI